MVAMKLTDLSGKVDANVGTLICSASFEARCLSIPRSLSHHRLESVIVFHHEDVPPPGRQHVDELRSLFRQKSEMTILEIKRQNPTYTVDRMVNGLAACRRDILIDITSFTHEALLILLRVLQEQVSPDRLVYLAYNPADSYGGDKEEEYPWLSRGLRTIRSVLGYPGILIPGRPLHLLVMAGYEPDRAARIIDAYQPSALSLGSGSEDASVDQRMHEINKYFVGGLAASQHSFRSFTFSCLEPERACQAVIQATKAYNGHNIVVAPMNTKLSTIGAALAAMRNPNIQLCYSVPEYYNTANYARPSDKFILEKISIPI